MSGSPFGILEYWSADKQTDAMSGASKLQYRAYMRAIDSMMEMWQKAQDNFAPFLHAGKRGLDTLEQSLPKYMQDVVMPAAQQYAAYQPTALPSANWSINPVTGEFTSGSVQTMDNKNEGLMQSEKIPMWQLSGGLKARGGAQADIDVYPKGETVYKSDMPLASRFKTSERYAQPQSNDGIRRPNASIGIKRTTPEQIPKLPMVTGQQPRTLQQMGSVVTPEQLAQGGVFSPAIPEFQRSLADFEFNPNDKVYQQKLSEKNKQVDRFLAKRGLQGSSAGEEFRQKEINKLLAEEEGRQYARARTERDYMTQTDIDKYRIGEQRGSTLYGRAMGQQQDMYKRLVQSALTGDQQALDQLQRQYGSAQNIYGLLYAAGLDLSKIGAGAAGSAGASSITTGQNVGQQYGLAGQAQAQGMLGQSAIWANYASGLGQNMGNIAGTMWQNWGGNSGGGGSGGGYYGGGGGGNYGIGGTGGYGPGGYDNWQNFL